MALKWQNNTVNTIKYSGRNLQPIKDWSQRTINGVTCSIKDGVGYLNGTSTAGSWQRVESQAISLSPGTYTIYFWTNFVQTTSPQLLRKLGLGLRSSGKDYYQCNTNKYRTFTLDAEETFDIVFWWQSANIVFDNIWIKSMVRPGTYDSTTEYDQYGPDNSSANLINYKNISSYTFTDLGDGSFKLNWGGGVSTITLPYSSFKTNTQYSFTLTSLNGAKYWAYNLMWNYSDGTSERFTSNQGLSYGTYSYTSAAGKTLSSITWQINFEADFYGLMFNEGQPKSYADNDVKMLEYNGDIVWCKPLIFTASASGVTGTYHKTATSEPTATTGAISSGAKIHYNDTLSIKYLSEVKTGTVTVSPSSVTAPVVTSQFTGSLGATIKNNNNFSVKAYYYIYKAGTRVPSSGYNSTTIAAKKNTTLTGLASASYANQTTIYVYFSASATRTTTTTTKYYSCTSSGIQETRTIETPLSTGDVTTEIIATAKDNVTLTISNTSTSSPSTTTSSTTINSTTKSCGLGY